VWRLGGRLWAWEGGEWGAVVQWMKLRLLQKRLLFCGKFLQLVRGTGVCARINRRAFRRRVSNAFRGPDGWINFFVVAE